MTSACHFLKLPVATHRQNISKGLNIYFSWTYMLNRKKAKQTATCEYRKFRFDGFKYNITRLGTQARRVAAVVIFS